MDDEDVEMIDNNVCREKRKRENDLDGFEEIFDETYFNKGFSGEYEIKPYFESTPVLPGKKKTNRRREYVKYESEEARMEAKRLERERDKEEIRIIMEINKLRKNKAKENEEKIENIFHNNVKFNPCMFTSGRIYTKNRGFLPIY